MKHLSGKAGKKAKSTIGESVCIIVFRLDEQRYALQLAAVERIVPIVEVTPLPKAPEAVSGVVNMEGRVLPVFNLRKRFRLPERECDLSDRLIIANTSRRTVALIVDEAIGVLERPGRERIAADRILPELEYLEGVVKLEDGLILIHDLDRFLSIAEERELNRAMEKT